MEYRGLSEECLHLLTSKPGWQTLLDRVRRDPDCCVEVRHNYLNCYYRGGSLFKMEFKPRSGQVALTFDSNYFKLKKTSPAAYGDLEAWIKSGPDDPGQWLERLEELKRVMAAWLQEHPKAEREAQQKIVKQNTFAHGNYQSIDIELAIPKDRKAGRMDVVAVRREGARYVPVIVELKHGKAAFDGKSGIEAHYHNTAGFLKDADREGYLVETILRIWKTKRRLGLLDGPVPPAEAFVKAELMFAVIGPKKYVEDVRKRLPAERTRTVRVAVGPAEELYFDNAQPLN